MKTRNIKRLCKAIKAITVAMIIVIIVCNALVIIGEDDNSIIGVNTEASNRITTTENDTIVYGPEDIDYTELMNPITSTGITNTENNTQIIEPNEIVEEQDYIELTDDEKWQLACLIYLEARGESEECQYAVGSVVLNRLTEYDKYTCIEDVIYAKHQFTPAKLIPETTPYQLQLDIVDELCKHGPTIPKSVTYFRAGYYHNFDECIEYNYFSNTYFSHDRALYEKYN